jgi:hypothetical protein
VGQVRFEAIMPLEYTVWASIDGYGPERTQAQVVEGQTTEVHILLAPYLIVIAHGWPGKESTRGFELAARTKLRAEKLNSRGEVWFAGLQATKAAFGDLFDALRNRDQQVQEFHLYSHSGETDGPIFSDGQFLGADVQAIAQVRWTPNARAYFYGCLAAYGYFSPLFATHQNVTVSASVGYTSFSARVDEFSPLPEFAMQGPPVYQASFLSRQEMRRRRFDYDTDRRPFACDADTLVRFAGGLPIATQLLRNYTLGSGEPPLPMAEIPPRSRPRFLREFSGRGDKIPKFVPRHGGPRESVP